MATVALQRELILETIRCGECGIEWGVPDWWIAERRRTHEGFYCPNGHCRAYKAKSVEEQQRARAEEAERRLNMERNRRLAAEAEQERVAKKLRRTEKRIEGGACPCCKRSFAQLAAHMKTKHPEYAKQKGAR